MEYVVAYLDGAEIGSVAQVVVAGLETQSGSLVTMRGGPRTGIEPAVMTVPGMSSESCWMRVERYRAAVALAVGQL